MAFGFFVDKTKEQKGIWVTFDPDSKQKFLIARFGTPHYLSVLEQVRDDMAKGSNYKKKKMSLEENAKAMAKAMAICVVLDWEGVLDENGDDMPYTPDNAFRLLTHSQEFSDAVYEVSNNEKNFYDEKLGNSKSKLKDTLNGEPDPMRRKMTAITNTG
jgi:hypothetical protein